MDLQEGERAKLAGGRGEEAVAGTHYTPHHHLHLCVIVFFHQSTLFSIGCVALGKLHGTSERAHYFGTVCLSVWVGLLTF